MDKTQSLSVGTLIEIIDVQIAKVLRDRWNTLHPEDDAGYTSINQETRTTVLFLDYQFELLFQQRELMRMLVMQHDR